MRIYPVTYIRFKYCYIDDEKYNSTDSVYVKGKVKNIIDCISVVKEYLSKTDVSKKLIEIDDHYVLIDRLVIQD